MTRYDVGATLESAIYDGARLTTEDATECVGEIIDLAKAEMADEVNAVLDIRLANAMEEIRAEMIVGWGAEVARAFRDLAMRLDRAAVFKLAERKAEKEGS